MKPIKPIYIAIPVLIALAGVIAHRSLAQSNSFNKPLNTPTSMITSGIMEPVDDRANDHSGFKQNLKERPVGGLYVQTRDRQQQQPFTLTNTDVKGKISGN
ncbi:MAG: trypsin, partial [Pseudanabaena sp.]